MSNPTTEAKVQTVTFIIDGKSVTVPKGTTVYTVAKQMGIEIPIFCYQDRMPPFGACRVCLVQVEKMAKLQTSCTLEATEGMVVTTQSAMAEQGRKEILELLLINHPLDCPICDRGGECPLQDQTIKYGPGLSRFFEEKRHFKKALSLGPVLTLDRERCIVCARCTRFGELVSGDHALEFIERGYKTEVGTPDGGPAESKFIGNTIMICPVGALTSEVYRFRARPWDNQPTKTTCTLCPVGCSMIFDSRDGEVMRTRSYENRNVNDIWLCDKGWFGYEFTSHDNRLEKPLIRRNGKFEAATWEEALSLIASKMLEAKPEGRLAALGGNPLTIEENYLFQKMMREGVGVNHIDHRLGMPILSLDEEAVPAGMEMSIGDCEELSFVFLMGLDLTEEFPVIWLRLKKAINHGAKVVFLGHFAPEIASYFSKTVLHAPGNEYKIVKEHLPEIEALVKTGNKGALFVGRQYLAGPNRRSILAELLKVRYEKSNLKLNLLEGRGNSIGARLAGMRPDLGPLGEHIKHPGFDAVKILEEAAKGWDFLYVAGANPATQFPKDLWREARAKLKFLVVQDLFLTETAVEADVVLPTLSFAEKSGSFMNIEGRIQKIQPGKAVPPDIYSDAEIFGLLSFKLNVRPSINPMFLKLLEQERLGFERPEKIEGIESNERGESGEHFLASFTPALFDHGVRMKHNPHLVKLAKEPKARIHPHDAAKRGIQDGSTVRVSANGKSIITKVKLDRRVAEQVVVLSLGFPEFSVHELGTNLMNGLQVKIESL